MSISTKFKLFCDNLKIKPAKISLISQRYKRITKQLNKDFWSIDSDTLNSLQVGSYGRDTDIVTSDVDIAMSLPWKVYYKYDAYKHNGQSNLLQAVKLSLKNTLSTTDLRGDGQVVVLDFSDGIRFEVVPCFQYGDKSYAYPDTNFGGSWRTTNPRKEIEAISILEKDCGNIKNLCRMVRAWKYEWDVPCSGLLIDTLAHDFLKSWANKDKGYEYYDYLTRDFFKFVSEKELHHIKYAALGSNDIIWRKGKIEGIAEECYKLSLEAIKFEEDKKEWSANQKWAKIYGTKFLNQ